jgi:hypothetical protein
MATDTVTPNHLPGPPVRRAVDRTGVHSLTPDRSAAFIAGQYAGRRDAWMVKAREARAHKRMNQARLAVAFARENSAAVVRLMRAIRSMSYMTRWQS